MPGLVELLEEMEAPRTDLYQLGSRLMLDVEDFLPIEEAAEFLGLCRVLEGHVELTERGRKLSTASVLERKKLFLEILKSRYGTEAAAQQLETLIDRGR